MTSGGYIEVAIAPLDRARRATFRWAAAYPRLRAILYRRDRRIAAQACIGVVVAFALAVLAPIAVMAVSPAVLGIPHVASDLRYLVLRQRLARWWLVAVATGCVAVMVLRVADELVGGGAVLDRVELAVVAVWLAAACIAGAAASRAWRRLVPAISVVAALATIGIARPETTRIVFAHLHNVVAVVLWAVVFRRRLRTAVLPLALIAIAAVVLASGATTAVTTRVGGDTAFDIDLAAAATWLAPGVSGTLATGLALSFVFLQGIHYSVWLGWIPQEQLPGEGTASFRRSLRALVTDFGATGTWLVVATSALMMAGSIVDVHRARELYLSLAVFHGYLELAMLGYLALARGRRS